jgi:hypothetical protein
MACRHTEANSQLHGRRRQEDRRIEECDTGAAELTLAAFKQPKTPESDECISQQN